MRIALSLPVLLACAATVHPTVAAAQAVGEGTTRIQAAGSVEIAGDGPIRAIASHTGVTFALSARRNGAVAVRMPGFIAAEQARGVRGLLLLADGAEHFLTGTNLAYETFSVSVNRLGGALAGPKGGKSVAVVLAQYN